jgi:signal transduction histidine kinase
MDADTLSYLAALFKTALGQDDWKKILDALFPNLRKEFVFDNAAVYLLEPATQSIEVAYARAVGRGRKAEADAAWGEDIANQVLVAERVISRAPQDTSKPGTSETDRLTNAHLLGLPVQIDGQIVGALVFVRFGGPSYTPEHRNLASLFASLLSLTLERRSWKEMHLRLEAIQRQIQLQEDFVATISHELRTPLGFIKGYTTTLLRQDTTWDEDTQREFLTIIDEDSDRLTELIENVLESAQLESDTLQMSFQPLRMDALIRDVVVRAKTLHKSLKIVMDFEPVDPIQGDGVRLAEIFDNLFSNAAKYAPNTIITISIRRLNDCLRITFADQGPGIPKEHLPKIFDRFYRVPTQVTSAGSGLGLYICKQIIHAHHGKIWAESKVGQGTAFFIELPVSTGT